ncbi:MAG: hypothetical protein K8I27_04775 [Planctomycetes bacterium]|nr:hypothetical protein [Planctomycetota bacterium]
MSLALKFGAEVLGAIRNLRVESAGDAPEVTETWRVVLQVEAATPGALEADVQRLYAARGATGDVSLVSGGDDIRTLAVADCRKGPLLANIAELDSAPGEAHNSRRCVLTLRGIRQDTGAIVQSHTLDVRLLTQAGLPSLIVQSGRAILRKGENPGDHESALLPALAPGHRRVRTVTSRDLNEPALRYEIEDEQVFAALPGGVEDGHYVVTDSLDADGRVVRTISGFFAGASAKARALELRPGDDRLLSARVSENPFQRRVDFEFREHSGEGDVSARAESLTFTTTRRVIDHALLDASLPAYRQQVGGPQTEVIQEGSAVGVGRHASPPPVRYAQDLIERRVHYSIPHPALPPERRWVTTWRYVCRGRAAIVESTP